MTTVKAFDPTKFSIVENQFLLKHVGEHPEVAFQDAIPQGTSQGILRKPLDEVYAYCEMEKARGKAWCGLDAVKEAITIYLRESARWAENAKRGAPRFPSLHVFDSRGRAHRGAVGADAGFVRTYYDAQGNRHPFAIDYVDPNTPDWVPEWVKEGVGSTPSGPRDMIETPSKSRVECPVCGHTESYNTDSKSSHNAAKARLARHFKTAKKDVEAHREALVANS